MAFLTAKTYGGEDWTPTFVQSINEEDCIGCGRCFKSCSRKVLAPEDYEDEETESMRMIMKVVNQDNCIGCAGCGVACPKKCFGFKPLEV